MFKGLSKNKVLFFRLLASYMTIVLIIVLIGIVGYVEAVKVIEDDARRMNMIVLEEIKEVMDSTMEDCELVAIRLAMSSVMNSAANRKKPLRQSFYYEIKDAMNEVSIHSLKMDSFESVFVYLKNSGYVVLPETVYQADFYFNEVLQYGDFDYEGWLDEINTKSNHMTFLPELTIRKEYKTSRVIPYYQDMQILPSQNSVGTIGVLIRSSMIDEQLNKVTNMNDGWFYIDSRDKGIITCYNTNPDDIQWLGWDELSDRGFIETNVNGDDMVIAYINSEMGDLRYVLALPTGSVMLKATYIKRFLSAMLFVAILMSGFIAYQLARRNMRPINSIVKLLNEVDPPGELQDNNAIDYVRGSIRFLIHNNNELKIAVDKQMPLLRAAFFKSLFQGEFKNEKEMFAVASAADIQLTGEAYLVFIIKLYGNEITTDIDPNIISELNIKRLLVKEIVEKHSHSECMLEIDNDSIAVLMKFDTIDTAKCKSHIEKVVNEINKELTRLYSMTVLFAAGNIYKDLLETDKSFEEARQILYAKREHPSSILLWYEDLPKQSEIYHYPIDLEQKIINFARTGEYDKVEALLNRVYEDNFVSTRISTEVEKELLTEMKGTLVKILPLCDLEEDKNQLISRFDIKESIENLFETTKDIYRKICESTNEKRNSSKKELAGKILDYIDENYAEPDICLYKVASQFEISEGYLCHFFKSYIKVNFTNYVESLRMRKAYEMLQDKKITIGDIAKAVGYNNVQSFRRAFKRQTGINPSSFRS